MPATQWIFRCFFLDMSDMSSALIRLGRLMELQGIASSRAGAAAETVSKRKSKGASGGGGATATAAEAGTPPEEFGARRIGGADGAPDRGGRPWLTFSIRLISNLSGRQVKWSGWCRLCQVCSFHSTRPMWLRRLSRLISLSSRPARRTQRRLWSTPTSLRAMEGLRCGVM